LGKATTKGYELELRVNHTFTGGHRVWGNFSMTHAASKINYREDAELLPSYRKQEGYAIGQQHAVLNGDYLNTQDELYGSPKHDSADGQKLVGDYQVVDFVGDGKISSDDTVPYAFTGIPENTYNATISMEWKGFSCFAQFYGVTNVTRDVTMISLADPMLANVYDQGTWWSDDHYGADVVTPRFNTSPDFYYGTQYLCDGSYVRLKNIELAYTWRGGWIKKLGMHDLKVYVSANNLWVWTRMPDDRESNFAANGTAGNGAYPTMKRINFGVKFNL
jgi:hypothetical protein